ncbi:hypothetical protein KKB44_03070 [Candidatus Micrarchaeota archaeon]|nr:hypothetical protein [Candidatus Micrarchaeota archaeon]
MTGSVIDRAQGRDKQAEKAGIRQRVFDWARGGESRSAKSYKYMAERVPVLGAALSPELRKDHKARKRADKDARIEFAKEERLKELRGERGQDKDTRHGAGGTPQSGADTANAEYLTKFTLELVDAIRRGQGRTSSGFDMLIREIVCRKEFIDGLKKPTVPTPLEELDTAYAERMYAVRQRLAQELSEGRVEDFDADRIDIIYSQMIGSRFKLDDKGNPIEQEDEQGNCVRDERGDKLYESLWTHETWPEGVALPPDAFFRFLENVAQRLSPGKEGEFIGSVLKQLSGTRSMDSENTQETNRRVLDGSYVDAYLESRTSIAIDMAADNFRQFVRAILLTPTNETVEGLGIPGTGHFVDVEGFGPCRPSQRQTVEDMMVRRAAAESVMEESAARVDAIDDEISEFRNERADAERLVERAEATVVEKTEQYDKVVKLKQLVAEGKAKATQKQIEDAERKATEEKDTAEQELVIARQRISEFNTRGLSLSARGARIEDEYTQAKEIFDTLSAELGGIQGTENGRFENVVRTYSENFKKHMLDCREVSTELIHELPNRAGEWLGNPVISELMKDTKKVLDRMDDCQQLFGIPSTEQGLRTKTAEQLDELLRARSITKAEYDAVIQERKGKGESEELFRYKLEAFDTKATALRTKVEGAELPDEVRKRMLTVVKAIETRKYPRASLEEMLVKIENKYSKPLGKAAEKSVEMLHKRTAENLGEIPQGQFVIARTIWEATKESWDPSPKVTVGKWQKFKDKWFWRLFTSEAWIGKSQGNFRGGRLRRLSSWGFGETVDDLKKRNWNKQVVGRNPITGKAHTYQHYPRWLRGLWKGALKAYLIGSFGVAWFTSPNEWMTTTPNGAWYKPWTYRIGTSTTGHWYNPFSWNAMPWRWSFNHFGNHFDRAPWEWWSPMQGELSNKRMINDSYDIPERLAEREDSYYTTAYGVTGEERLDWLRDNQVEHDNEGVLTFFQERRTLKHVRDVNELDDDDIANCSQETSAGSTSRAQPPPREENAEGTGEVAEGTNEVAEGTGEAVERPPATPGLVIPNSCRELGIESMDDVENWEPLAIEDEWESGNQFCCIIDVEYTVITDGLKLNRNMTNEFVDYLMAQEGTRATVDYDYMNEHTRQWVERGFLVSEQQERVMDNYNIADLGLVDFVFAQGRDRVGRLMLPLVAERGEHTEYLKPENREAFVTLWEEKTQARAGEGQTLQTRRVPVTDVMLEETFNEAMATARTNGWVEDTSEQYARRELRRELSEFDISDSMAYTLLAPTNQDIRELLTSFVDTRGARYRLNRYRLEEFVEELQRHKADGGNVSDYNPFSDPQGVRVQWAVDTGYINEVERFRGTGTERSGTELNAEAQQFYTIENDFNSMLDGTLERLFTDEGEDGQLLRSAFEGNREQTEMAIRAEWYRLLTSDIRRDVQHRTDYGLTVSGEGEEFAVQITDMGRARRGIERHTLSFVGRENE